jgi:hypothetical protein
MKPRAEAVRWSELPDAISRYIELSDKEGNSLGRLFGYASIIKDNANEKPSLSSSLKDEPAVLPGMEVAMNVLAAGKEEYRGTRDTYINEQGQEKHFANVGVYAGLETATSEGGYASGMNITTWPENRACSLKSYIKRELGAPPNGISLDDLFDPQAKSKFAALEGTPEDEFGMYKFEVVDTEVRTETGTKKVPSVTVSTNEKSKFAAIGLSPMQTAALILDGHGYTRTYGTSTRGGTSLDYFKDAVIAIARQLGLKQPKLEAIDAAVEQLAAIQAQIHGLLASNPTTEKEFSYFDPINSGPMKGVYSPLFYEGENVNTRPPVSAEDKARSVNQMAHTAEQKIERIAALHWSGKTQRSR